MPCKWVVQVGSSVQWLVLPQGQGMAHFIVALGIQRGAMAVLYMQQQHRPYAVFADLVRVWQEGNAASEQQGGPPKLQHGSTCLPYTRDCSLVCRVPYQGPIPTLPYAFPVQERPEVVQGGAVWPPHRAANLCLRPAP